MLCSPDCGDCEPVTFDLAQNRGGRHLVSELHCGLQTVATVSLVGLEPDQIPQLWTYLLNSTALSAGGTALTTTGDLTHGLLTACLSLFVVTSPSCLLPAGRSAAVTATAGELSPNRRLQATRWWLNPLHPPLPQPHPPGACSGSTPLTDPPWVALLCKTLMHAHWGHSLVELTQRMASTLRAAARRLPGGG